jgi:polyphenol oxidase
VIRDYLILTRVLWSPSSCQSTLLGREGFRHQFVGVDGTKPHGAHHLKQVHGVEILQAEAALSAPDLTGRADGDALWTADPLVTVAVKTADCLPVLLADPNSRRVMALHAGWRGLTTGIIGRAIQTFEALNLNLEKLIVAIGPSISREHYEVGEEVAAALFEGDIKLSPTQASLAIAKGQADKWHLDLKVAAVSALINAGLEPNHIEIVQACTYREKFWHSYRREGRGCGSNWSWITPVTL